MSFTFLHSLWILFLFTIRGNKGCQAPCSLWWFLVLSCVHFAPSVPLGTPSRRAKPLGISVRILCEISERDRVLVWGAPILQFALFG